MELQKDGRSFKGSPYCKRGHLKEFGKQCVECNKIRCQKHFNANREQHRRKALEWHYAHRDEHLAKMSAYQKENRELCAEQQRKWRHSNLDRLNEKSRWRYANDPDFRTRHKALVRSWKDNNPDVWREISRAAKSRRRARIKGNFGSHTAAEWLAVLAKFKNRCAYCGTRERIEKDHIVPVLFGGSEMAINLQPLCRKCNLKKSVTIAEGTQLGIFDRIKETV